MRREFATMAAVLTAYACALVLGSLIICVGAYASDVAQLRNSLRSKGGPVCSSKLSLDQVNQPRRACKVSSARATEVNLIDVKKLARRQLLRTVLRIAEGVERVHELQLGDLPTQLVQNVVE